LRLWAQASETKTVCNLKIHFNAVDNATAPTTYAAFMALSLDAGIAWNSIPPWTVGLSYDSPSLVSALQAIIDREGWASGQSLQIIIKNNGSSVGARRKPTTVEQEYGINRVLLYTRWIEP
jgi:hypothetical protein